MNRPGLSFRHRQLPFRATVSRKLRKAIKNCAVSFNNRFTQDLIPSLREGSQWHRFQSRLIELSYSHFAER